MIAVMMDAVRREDHSREDKKNLKDKDKPAHCTWAGYLYLITYKFSLKKFVICPIS